VKIDDIFSMQNPQQSSV